MFFILYLSSWLLWVYFLWTPLFLKGPVLLRTKFSCLLICEPKKSTWPGTRGDRCHYGTLFWPFLCPSLTRLATRLDETVLAIFHKLTYPLPATWRLGPWSLSSPLLSLHISLGVLEMKVTMSRNWLFFYWDGHTYGLVSHLDFISEMYTRCQKKIYHLEQEKYLFWKVRGKSFFALIPVGM